jgi:hypothetical protein
VSLVFGPSTAGGAGFSQKVARWRGHWLRRPTRHTNDWVAFAAGDPVFITD